MRSLLFTLAIIFFFSLTACNNSTPEVEPEQEDSTDVVVEQQGLQFNTVFPELHQYFLSEDTSFSPTDFEESESRVKGPDLDLPVDTTELRRYSPYLLFNSDSSLALDAVSYNYLPVKKGGVSRLAEQGPDFEVSLVNFKTGKKRRLLFFGASGGSFLDAKWQNDSTLLMAGALDWNDANSLRPVMWRYTVPTGEWQQFTSTRIIQANWAGYPKKPYELNAVRTSPVF